MIVELFSMLPAVTPDVQAMYYTFEYQSIHNTISKEPRQVVLLGIFQSFERYVLVNVRRFINSTMPRFCGR